MERTLNLVAVLMFASTSSFVTFTLPSYSAASWSRIGAIIRHGPHQVAQKSTTVSFSCFSTSDSKSASVTVTAFDMLLRLPRQRHRAAPRISIQRRRLLPGALPMTHALPPRRATRIAHVGIAVRALDDILPFYRDILDLPEVPLDDADGARIAGLAAGDSLVELLEAESPDSPIGKFVARRGPGIHHLRFAVADLDRALDRCRAAGVRLID